jgi:serine kinase of HPr protein (carbohydrate metabolism regulator)
VSEIVHAGLIAAHRRGYWRGVLVEGSSGAGKSDLALRAEAWGFRLVADDRTILWISAGRVFGGAPPVLAGLLEVRGLDVVATPAVALAEVVLVMRCNIPERLPERRFANLLGVSLPLVEFDPREASAPAKLSRALDLFDLRDNRRI